MTSSAEHSNAELSNPLSNDSPTRLGSQLDRQGRHVRLRLLAHRHPFPPPGSGPDSQGSTGSRRTSVASSTARAAARVSASLRTATSLISSLLVLVSLASVRLRLLSSLA